MMLAPALAFLLQDPAIDEQIKALSHEDIAVRDKAAAELLKTPLSKLDLLEKHLQGPNAETCVRVRRIMTHVLASNLGSRKARFQFSACATPEVMKDWIDKGADPAKPPKGHECLRMKSGPLKAGEEYEIYKREWILVEPSILTQEDIDGANAEATMGQFRESWQVNCKFTKSGADTFDKWASILFDRKPNGMMAIVFDGRILTAPVIRSPRFSGNVTISGSFAQAEAKDLATILRGNWLESSMRAERERKDAAPPEKVMDQVRSMKGLGRVVMSQDANSLDIAGFVDIKEVDLVDLWLSLREQGYRLVPKK